jgi:hypothetical protein
MIEKKLETYSHEELIELENGVHAAIQTFQTKESEPYFEETQDLLIGLLTDILGAQREKLFPENDSPEWRSFTVENHGDEERVDANGERVFPEGDTP